MSDPVDPDERYQRLSGPVNDWFELSYAQYLTLPRSVLQSMPVEWQERFALCLRQLDDRMPWRPTEGRYWVRLKDGAGRFVHDPFMEYRHRGILEPADVARLRGKPWVGETKA